MQCRACQNVPTIPSLGGNVIISAAVPELILKMANYLEQKEIGFSMEDPHTLIFTVSDFKEFIQSSSRHDLFNRLEADAIQLLFLEHEETFGPTKLKSIKTLQKYHHLLGALELSSLIRSGALTTHFQPIVDLKSSTIFGYESLIRGVNDDGSLIYPHQLFNWAREGEMLFALDRACRESSLKTAAIKHISSKVFINFIPTAIYDPNHCLQSTVKWAKQLEFDPKNIIFEVIESDLVEDLDHLKKILDFYKSQGFMVALDDVGSGYSSLNMIAKLQPDIVKIDRCLIDHIDTNEVSQSVFRAIVQMAHENGIKVLAEGIERIEEVAFCSANGADLAQGYYFGKPSSEPIRRL